jgi:hypothetical protein
MRTGSGAVVARLSGSILPATAVHRRSARVSPADPTRDECGFNLLTQWSGRHRRPPAPGVLQVFHNTLTKRSVSPDSSALRRFRAAISLTDGRWRPVYSADCLGTRAVSHPVEGGVCPAMCHQPASRFARQTDRSARSILKEGFTMPRCHARRVRGWPCDRRGRPAARSATATAARSAAGA